jgi:hypothetical protein
LINKKKENPVQKVIQENQLTQHSVNIPRKAELGTEHTKKAAVPQHPGSRQAEPTIIDKGLVLF